MKTIKIIFKCIAGIIIVMGVMWIVMPFAFMYPFLYIKYTLNPEMTPGMMDEIIKENPKAEELFVVEKAPKKFEPADAQKEFDKMSSSMRLMNSLGMLGIMARQKTRETGGEPYEN